MGPAAAINAKTNYCPVREETTIREIERRTGLSRNTMRNYLRSGAVEPKFNVPDRPSNLDPFAEKLAAWLRVEEGKSRKQRRTAQQAMTQIVDRALHKIPASGWIGRTLPRKPRMLVGITLANKMARQIWAMLIKKEDYRNPALATAA